MTIKKLFTLLMICTAVFTLAGCGKNKALENYKLEMTAFSDRIIELNTRINQLDPASETAKTELLASLDELDQEFAALAAFTVPQQYLSIEMLADEASTYMTESVLLYHIAFESTDPDDYNFTLAKDKYDRANKRMHYIFEIIGGNVPEDENIILIQ